MAICNWCDQEMTGKGASCVMGDGYRIRYDPCIGCATIIERESKAAPGVIMRYPEPAKKCHPGDE